VKRGKLVPKQFYDKTSLFRGRTIEKFHLGVKEKNHNIGGVRLDCSSEVLLEYRLE